jgi:hypothetical protein
MHKFQKMMMVAALTGITGMALAQGPVLRPLSMQEMARYGATDQLLLRASDLTDATDNRAQTNTVTLTGPCSYEYIGFLVDQAFDSSLTTNTLSSTFTMTIGSDTLINALQIANDTWRPYKSSWHSAPTVATTTSGPNTNKLVSVSTVSAPYKGVVTNGATATITTIVTGPDASTSLAEVDSGQLRVFLRIMR